MATFLDNFLDSEMRVGTDHTMKGDLYSNDGCFKFISRWLMACGYPNPENYLPFMYDTAQEYRRGSRACGGFVNVANLVAKKVGLRKPMFWGSLEPGDIGLVHAQQLTRPNHAGTQRLLPIMVLGIRAQNNLWATKTHSGLFVAPLEIVDAWQVAKKEEV